MKKSKRAVPVAAIDRARTEVIDNACRPIGKELVRSLRWATDVRIASAFVTRFGLNRIWTPLRGLLERGGTATVVYGLDCQITDPEVPERLLQLAEDFPQQFCQYVRLQQQSAFEPTLHTKLYIFIDDACARVIIGSSNLTRGGLSENIEANALIAGPTSDPVVADACDAFDRVRDHGDSRIPSRDFVAAYRDLMDCERTQSSQHRPELKEVSERLDRSWQTLVAVNNEFATAASPGSWFRLDGRIRRFPTAKQCFVAIFEEFAKRDPTFCPRFADQHEGRTLVWIAQTRHALYPERPRLVMSSTEPLPGGWYLGTNIGNRDKERRIERACGIMGLRYGTDVTVNLGPWRDD